jgi:hypothetical protein
MARGKHGRTGYEDVTGETPDISEWIDFDFYDAIWYHDPPETGAETTSEVRKLGRWLGVANRVGTVLTYWVLTRACQVLNRSTIQHVTAEERLDPTMEQRIADFNKDIQTRLDDTGFVIANTLGSENVLQDEGELYPDERAYGDGTVAWAMSSDTYVKNMLDNVKEILREKGKELRTTKRRGRTPLPTTYKPELDVTRELDTTEISEYLQLIGMLRWAVELGRIDIALETALMSQYSASPREGHLEAVYYIFAYLTLVPSGKITFDPRTPSLDETCFQTNVDWKPFYGDIHEEMPLDMPTPLGMPVNITCFVDANHAGNVMTRRSQTGILIFIQNAPILWHSKKQNTVEASTFGSELVAMRIARDLIVALRIKLRYFGVPINGPASILCDNQGVVKNTSIPTSTLTKKHNAINYHIIRESAAMGIIRVGKEDTETNLADLLTKILNQPRRESLLEHIMYLDDRKIRGHAEHNEDENVT